jgi:hypothetical protein
MPTYSTRLRLTLQATGENSNSWGLVNNLVLGTLIEQAVAGVAGIQFTSDADRILSTANGAADEARNAVLQVTSTVALTAQRSIIIPGVQKTYWIANGTTGGQAIAVKTASGVGAVIPAGATALVYCDGTNCGLGTMPYGAANTSIGGATTVAGNLTVAGAISTGGQIAVGALGSGIDPTDAAHVATKKYADTKFPIAGGFILGNLGVSLPSSPGTGAIFLGNSNVRYLQYDGTYYQMPGSPLKVNGGTVWTDATFTPGDYLPKAGGAITGGLSIAGTATAGDAFGIRGNSNLNLLFQTAAAAERALIYYDASTNSLKSRVNGSSYILQQDVSGRLKLQPPRGTAEAAGWALTNSQGRLGDTVWNDGGAYLQISVDGAGFGIAASPSDARLKDNVTPAEHSALEKIGAMRFVDFDWKRDAVGVSGGRRQRSGVIAQEVRQLDPNFVFETDDGRLHLNTTALLTSALHAIAQLRGRVAALEAR